MDQVSGCFISLQVLVGDLRPTCDLPVPRLKAFCGSISPMNGEGGCKSLDAEYDATVPRYSRGERGREPKGIVEWCPN